MPAASRRSCTSFEAKSQSSQVGDRAPTPVRCRGELPNIRGMFSALRYFDISSNVVGGFIPQAWADTGIIRLVRS